MQNRKDTANTDSFLWLENLSEKRALEWVSAENARTRAALKSDQDYQAIHDIALEQASVKDCPLHVAPLSDDMVVDFRIDRDNPLGLLRKTTLASYKTDDPQWETLLDLDELAAREGIDWVYCGLARPFGVTDRGIISLSPDGGDARVWREFDIASKRFVEDGFNAPASKSQFAWHDADTLLISAAFRDDEMTECGYPRVVRIWRRGTPLEAAETIFETGRNDVAVSVVALPFRDETVTFIDRHIDFERKEVYLRRDDGTLMRLPVPEQAENDFPFADRFFFSVKSPWTPTDQPPGQTQTLEPDAVYCFDLGRFINGDDAVRYETLLAPAPEQVLLDVNFNGERIFISLRSRMKSEIITARHEAGRFILEHPDLPRDGETYLGWCEMYENRNVLVFNSDFLVPETQYLSQDSGQTFAIAKQQKPLFDARDMCCERLEAISADGTAILYDLVRPRDPGGPVPTVLYGYGGFGSCMFPFYLGTTGKTWLERGNAYVQAYIRGGGEHGEAWHQAATGRNRQKAFDDFIAIAESLIARRITTPRQLGIHGGSNGGLLVGAAMTQRPELFGAVLMEVPLADMLRYTKLSAGASWISEYGDPDDPDDAAALRAYSPYHNIRKGVSYPPVLITTSTADDRVHPGHARKMAARLRAAGHDRVWFLEEEEGGHAGPANLFKSSESYAMRQVFWRQHLERGGR